VKYNKANFAKIMGVGIAQWIAYLPARVRIPAPEIFSLMLLC